LPFMSLPVLPSDYRPVSVLIFLLTGILILRFRLADRKIPWDEFLLFGFFCLCFFQTMALVGIEHGAYVKALRHLVVLFLGILSYISIKAVFQVYGIDYALRLMAGVYVFIFAIGLLEVLSILHILPWSVKAGITYVLGGHTVQRVQLVTSEASWAAKVLLFGIPLYIFLLRQQKKRIYLAGLLVAIGLFGFTLSLDGFLVAGIAVVIFALFNIRFMIQNPKMVLVFLLILIGLVAVFSLSFRLFPKGHHYFTARIHDIGSMDLKKIKELPRKDGSVFIRVYYPLLGAWMFLEKPYGTGLGGYSIYFKSYLDRVGIDYTRFPEVMGDIRTQTGDPKSLYAKILSENGLYSMWVLILFFALHLYYLKRIPSDGIIPYRNLVIALLAVNLAILFQFGSYAFLPMWFTFALNAEIYRVHASQVRI